MSLNREMHLQCIYSSLILLFTQKWVKTAAHDDVSGSQTQSEYVQSTCISAKLKIQAVLIPGAGMRDGLLGVRKVLKSLSLCVYLYIYI